MEPRRPLTASGGVGAGAWGRLPSGVPTSPSGSSLLATSDGTREGLESLQGGVCLTRGMKVLLRVGQSEWGWNPILGAEGGWDRGSTILGRGFWLSSSLGCSPSPGPRGGAAPRKPVSEVPMERDRGAARSLDPGKENMPGRNQGQPPAFPSLLCSWTPAALPSPFPPPSVLGVVIQERGEERMGGWEENGSQMRRSLN